MELLDNGTFGQLNVWAIKLFEFRWQKFSCQKFSCQKFSCLWVPKSKVQLSKVQLSKVQLSMSSVVYKFSCQKYKRSVAQKIRYLEFNCLKFKCPALLKILYLRYRISDKSSRVPFHMIQSLYKLLVWSFIRKRHPSCKKRKFQSKQNWIFFALIAQRMVFFVEHTWSD